MKIEILFFGITTDIVGTKTILLDIQEETTIETFRGIMIEKYPKLQGNQSFSIALNMEYAKDTAIINNGDVIALIPPVSGG